MNEVAWIEARTLGIETARETWALAARQVLADAAGTYHAVVTLPELATAVQQKSRIRTGAAPRLWMGDVLFRVASECHRRREPLLSALCVGADGRMGEWYADTVLTVRGDRVADPEQHAAEERLDCYRVHGAELPAGGGEPALPPRPQPARRAARTSAPRPGTPRATGTRAATSRAASARTAAAPRRAAAKPAPEPAKVCPTCFMALPATGVCDNCD